MVQIARAIVLLVALVVCAAPATSQDMPGELIHQFELRDLSIDRSQAEQAWQTLKGPPSLEEMFGRLDGIQDDDVQEIVDPDDIFGGGKDGQCNPLLPSDPDCQPPTAYNVLANGLESDTLDYESGVPAIDEDACPVSFSMPFDLARSLVFYTQTEDSRLCSKAVKEIRALEASFGTAAARKLRQRSALAESDFLKGMVERYVESCTQPLNSTAASFLFGEGNMAQAFASIGILSSGTQRCIGTIVDGKVITSRHCFASGDTTDGSYRIVVPPTGAILDTFLGARYSLLPDGDPSELTLSDAERQSDWIVLEISGESVTAAGLDLHPEFAERWSPLALISVSPYKRALLPADSSIREAVTVDLAPHCAVLAKDGPFIFHSCQTIEGMSGSPLLTLHEGKLAVVGIHSGSAKSLPTPCGAALSARYTNYGLSPQSAEDWLQ